jgi:Rieske Fe-S protein
LFSNKKHSRRYFIKSVFAGLTIGFVVLWDKMVFTQKKIVGNKTISIPLDTNKQISFNDEFIVINKDANTKVFSSRCTHLGCKINKSKNNELLCPCHGSTFDLNGNPTKGPAIKPLEQKDFEISNSTININI